MALSLGSRCLNAAAGRSAVHSHRPARALPRLQPRPRSRQVVPLAALPASLPRPSLPWEDTDAGGGSETFPSAEPDFPSSFPSRAPSKPPSSSPGSSSSSSSNEGGLKPLPRNVEGVADDVTLGNPLQRMERLGTAWFGTIFELDGVCVEYECGDGSRSWQQLAAEEGKPPPPLWALKKSQGMKNEQVVSEVFCWTRNPVETRRLAARREEILAALLGGRKPLVPGGVTQLMDMLQRNQSPLALVSSAPEKRVLPALASAGLEGRFDAVVTADDVYRGSPDPEGYLYAAQRLQRPPMRCVVIGSSNLSIEAAHEVGMKCVALAGRHPVYELSAADLVVRDLSQLSFVNLKRLFAAEETVALRDADGDEIDRELALEEEEESDSGSSYVTTQLMDR